MLLEKLKEREIPDLLTLEDGRAVKSPDLWSERRAEIMEILKSEIYGFAPVPPETVKGEVEEINQKAFAGKAVHSSINIKFDTPRGEFSFPINLIIPENVSSPSLFLHIAFRPDIPDRYFPVEEILDNGFAMASFCYKDVVPDNNNFDEGLAKMYPGEGDSRQPDDWGKISMWAWAAQRVMDYLQTLEEIDREQIAVVGHSRLGKTALWCGAQDKRFAAVFSNDSGCSGAALSRGKKGETIKDITNQFPFWFCPNYQKYINDEENMPCDQHFLLAAIAPRPLYVSSAEEDEWADPESEFLSCVAASEVYKLLGVKGLVTPDQFPETDTTLHQGKIGYHLRKGTHYLSRYDWQCFMKYMKRKF